MKSIQFISFLLVSLTSFVQAQDPLAQQTSDAPESEVEQRVQYTLILPEEKTPELIKADENNPFEVAVKDAKNKGDSEENRVRDILAAMPAVGGGAGPAGKRVMLGGMRLEVGAEVPKVIPDQQVVLRVKSIDSGVIELVWIEKTPTGLPPKPFSIPVDISPNIRYKMPSKPGGAGGGPTGTLHHDEVSAAIRSNPSNNTEIGSSSQTTIKAVAVEDASDTPSESPNPIPNVPEAAVIRMLFGTPGPKSK